MKSRIESPPAAAARTTNGDWLAENRQLLLVLLFAMFVVAAAIRAYKIDAAGVLVDRDYTSAMFSRDFYFAHAEGIEPWRREMARTLREKQPDLEPPVTEWLVAQAYRLVGREDLRLARILTSAFWLAGGVFLFAIIRSLVSTDAAVLGLGYYLFQPMSVLLSRSFQADSLMMLMYLASLWGIVQYYQRPSRPALLMAALLAAATLVYRPLVLPALAGAFLVPQMQRHGFWKAPFSRESIVYGLVGLLPAVLYYGYATFIASYFGWKLTSSFRFHLWGHHEYWQGWWELALIAVGLPFLIAAAVGFMLLREGLPRAILIGLSVGYLVFGLMFTMHIHTHDYYHAQLIPLVAIAASPLAAWMARAALRSSSLWPKLAAIVVAGVVTLSWARQVNAGLHRAGFEPPETAQEIGRLVGHSDRVVFLSRYYGLALQYLGEFTGAYWPRPITYWLYRTEGESELSIAERLDALGFEPEYFVITFFREYEKNHADLAVYLESHCTLTAKSDAYLIYERCNRPDAGIGESP